VKDECLSKLILFGERSLKRALHHYEMHYHQGRNDASRQAFRTAFFLSPCALSGINSGIVQLPFKVILVLFFLAAPRAWRRYN